MVGCSHHNERDDFRHPPVFCRCVIFYFRTGEHFPGNQTAHAVRHNGDAVDAELFELLQLLEKQPGRLHNRLVIWILHQPHIKIFLYQHRRQALPHLAGIIQTVNQNDGFSIRIHPAGCFAIPFEVKQSQCFRKFSRLVRKFFFYGFPQLTAQLLFFFPIKVCKQLPQSD